jgi:hypothetical protein
MFVLIQKYFGHVDFDLLTGIYQNVQGLNKFDAEHKARVAQPGTVALGVAEGEARMMADTLANSGVETILVPIQNVTPVAKPRTINAGGPNAVSFDVVDMYGRSTIIPWSDCLLISAGVIAEEFTVYVPGNDSPPDGAGRALRHSANVIGGITLATMGVGVFFKKKKKQETERDREEVQVDVTQQIELFTTHPDFSRLRMRLTEFNYSCLGPRNAGNANDNFHALVAYMIECAGDSVSVDPQLIDYVDDPNRLPAFSSEDYWDAYNFWQLQTRNMNK